MKVAVLGAGAWGTALAQVLCENGHDTSLWTWQADHAARMKQTRENEFLPGVRLFDQVQVSSELEDVLDQAEIVTVVVPSSAVRQTIALAAGYLRAETRVVCATKGIEQATLQLMSEVVEDELARTMRSPILPIGALSGPSFAREVGQRLPTNLVAASKDPELALLMQRVYSTPWLRVYTSDDPIGVEIGGALKNVIAIAAGACDGLGLGENTRAALITRGIAEMARLVRRKQGSVLTLAGLAGMGDLVLTCTGSMSRNRTLGYKIGSGMSVEAALSSSDGVAEGYITAKSAHDLALSLGVELPICKAVHSVLYEGKSASDALADLLSRPLRSEWEDER